MLEIDVARVDGFRDELAERSRIIRDAAARGKPLMEQITPEAGRRYKRRKRALSNGSINEILALLSQILQRAADYGYIERNAMRVGERRERFLPTSRTRRTFLEVDEFHALLDAAGELDRQARRDHRVGRRAALATLGLAGFRISEFCGLHCAQVDLARARFKLADAGGPRDPDRFRDRILGRTWGHLSQNTGLTCPARRVEIWLHTTGFS